MLDLPQSALKIINQLYQSGYEGYAVGGSVRDSILNRPTKQWDFTTNATPEQIMRLFPDSFYDNEFGTVGIKIKNKSDEVIDIYEITTFRSEQGYKDRRHPDQVVWGSSLTEDLARRDFTINTIATDGKSIIDPYAGQQDLKDKIIRTVGDPNERFREDALRLFRAVRIATELGFMIEPKTFSALQTNAHLLQHVSADRIRNELMRLLSSKFAADGILVLKNSGLLHIFLPELEETFSTPQKSPKRHHKYDVGTHLIESLRFSPTTDPLVKLATLLHDIGKPVVFKKDQKTDLITFYNHETVGAGMVKRIVHRLNFSKKDADKLIKLVRWHQFTVDEQQTDATLRRFIKRVGKENLKDILDLRIGDRLGGGARETSWRLRLFIKRLEEVQKQPFTVADLKISGHDVMRIFGINSGPLVGKVLNELFTEVITQKLENEREILLKRLNRLKEVETSVTH